MRNLIAGAKYLETIGDLVVHNETTSEKAVLNFEAAGWSGKRNQVAGLVYAANGSKAAWIDGVWDGQLKVRYGSSHDPSHLLWAVNPWPAHVEKSYGFTYWAMSLNQLLPGMQDEIAPSDSRLRPDQRAYEEGRLDEADRLKNELEEAQRHRKQVDGDYIKPRWFRPANGGGSAAAHGEDEWEYAGGYFESLAEGKLKQDALNGLFEH